jgi:hypothetical protein
MSREDYEINGENISKVVKRKKVAFGLQRWNNLYQKYEINIISNKNNIILFSINDKEYYYGLPSQKIKRRYDRVWNSKIITELKKDFDKIPLRENVVKKVQIKKIYPLPTDMAPGKHKDKTWLQVKQEDENYIKWMISVTKNKQLKNMLLKL